MKKYFSEEERHSVEKNDTNLAVSTFFVIKDKKEVS